MNINLIGGGYPIMTEPKGCVTVSNECTAIGIDTTAGLSLQCIIENGQLAIIPNYIGGDFYIGCQIGLANLSGGLSPVTSLITFVSTVSIINTTDTLLTFTNIVTDHTSGIISLIADWASTAEGYQTFAFGKYSHAGGVGAVSDLPSKWAWSDNTSSQYGIVTLNALTTDTTPTIMAIAGAPFIIRINRTYTLFAHIGARKTDGSQHAYFIRQGVIHNENNNLYLVDSIITVGTDFNDQGWSVDISPNGQSLNFTVTGSSATTIKWFAKCESLEL